jgi:microcystin-dependent protein
MFAGNFEPVGWMFCDGQLLAISENDTLFNLIGTTYGGDGQNTFALPDLRGRLSNHQGFSAQGINYTIGENGGAETVTLTTRQIPSHNHNLIASQATADQIAVSGNMLASPQTVSLYNGNTPNKTLAGNALGNTGGDQPHNNVQPYLCVSFIISLYGIFPSQT